MYAIRTGSRLRQRLASTLQLCRANQHRRGPIVGREQPLQFIDLGQIVDDDVGAVRVQREVILVIGLGRIEGLERLDRRCDGSAKRVRPIELIDVALRDACLIRICRKDR